jgi:hypothetical protein
VDTTACEACGGDLRRSDRALDGLVLESCRACRRIRIAGDTEWFAAAGIGAEVLRARGDELARWRHMMRSDGSDPMWGPTG